MIRLIKPLDSRFDFESLTSSLLRILNDPDSFKFLSYSLINFDKETIEKLTNQHRENGIDYLVSENKGLFSGILAVKRKRDQGFELYLLVVNKDNQKTGIGQSLINECLTLALKENFKSIDSFVFADNKNMLRLLIKNDFRPVAIEFHARADGMDVIKLRKYI
jgi:ribosomal protein S18 acetylase RimI-like enzyme